MSKNHYEAENHNIEEDDGGHDDDQDPNKDGGHDDDQDPNKDGGHVSPILCVTCRKSLNSHQALKSHQVSHCKMKGCFARMKSLASYHAQDVEEDVVQNKKMETFAISNASLLYFDGSYRRSHDHSSGGNVVYDTQGNLVRKQGLKLESNNEIEYMALEGGLHICLQMGIKCLQIKGDSLIVVKQVLKVWKNKYPKLKNSCFRVKVLLKKFEAWSLQHIEKSQNEEAYEAAQGMITCVFVVNENAPLSHGRDMLSKEVDFLLIGILPKGLLS
ncbi:hypothetical protein L7F22_068916 [Adiantum nelumboides]|nr:hypothetical protein [Adiantum nelumboides]